VSVSRPTQERLWEKVSVRGSDECWPWIGGTRSGGYGQLFSNEAGKFLAIHRLAYEEYFGSPGDLCVCHMCDNKVCCNPYHLFLGTYGDNNRDASRKGRARNGELRESGPNYTQRSLNDEAARVIKFMVTNEYRFGLDKKLARLYGVSYHLVSKIRHGDRYKDISIDPLDNLPTGW